MTAPAEQQFPLTEDLSVAEQVVSAVASTADVDPASLSPKLYDSIDPDALERLFDRPRTERVTVAFEYGDWLVRVENDFVAVSERPRPSRNTAETETIV